MKRPFPIHDKVLEKDIYAGLVTSLCFHSKDILVSGHGPFLKVYNIQTNECLHSQLVLPSSRIHRIVPVNDASVFAVYGSKFLSIVELNVTQNSASITVQKTLGPFSDWIMDAQWINSTNGEKPTELALAFAHNFVEIYDIQPTVPKLLYSIQCQVRCILNSARFFGHTRKDLVLASGTVFNDIYLWKVEDGQVFRELKGHEGVIFSIRFNHDASRIISASDDRTVRVWGSDDAPLILFGHTARVWDCMFVDGYVVSISEDSTCRVWNEEGDCVACWEGHAGKNIWSCAVDPEHKTVATGGQDSGILLWSMRSIENNKVDAKDDLNTFVLPKGKDSIRNFSFVNDSTLVVVTAMGCILKTNTSDSVREWTEILYAETLKNYNVMKHSECGRVIVFGNSGGDLIIVSPTGVFEPIKLNLHKQKVFDLFVIPSLDTNILYIVSNSFNEPLLFHKLDLTDATVPLFNTLYSLKMPSERTTILCTGFSEQDGLFTCGTRESNLVLYHLDLKSVTEDIKCVEPSLLLSKAHDNQAVTSIIFNQTSVIDEEEEDEVTGLAFWTTGRDGCFNRYRLFSSNDEWSIEKVYTNRVTKGLLEGAVLVDGELLLLGFYRKHFFVYNEKKNFNVLSIACGGGHRRWQFSTKDSKLNKSFFGFTNKEGVCTYFRDTVNEGFKDNVLQENYHGREVRAIQFLPLFDKDAPLLFATAGEDTLLRIQQYTPWTSSKFSTLASLRKHTTVIKNINYSKGISTLLFTSGGLEELLCWKIEASMPKGNKLAHLDCIQIAACPTLSKDIETRIMDTTTYVLDTGFHLIGAVYSDAMIRFWLFNEHTNQFSLVGDGTWHAKCILQIKHVVIHDRLLFFTSATDGRIAFWDLTDAHQKAPFQLSEPIYHYSAHMSGVNALEIIPFKDEDHFLIVTGGEDNALTASLFSIQNEKIQPIGSTFTIPDAHASSITGIKSIDDSIFTTSTDQRLNMWRVNTDTGVSFTLINAAYMDVPDPSAIDGVLYNDHVHIAITGVGLQSVRYHQ